MGGGVWPRARRWVRGWQCCGAPESSWRARHKQQKTSADWRKSPVWAFCGESPSSQPPKWTMLTQPSPALHVGGASGHLLPFGTHGQQCLLSCFKHVAKPVRGHSKLVRPPAQEFLSLPFVLIPATPLPWALVMATSPLLPSHFGCSWWQGHFVILSCHLSV